MKDVGRLIVVLVTPCVGVWIETASFVFGEGYGQSHPAWVCGLKLVGISRPFAFWRVTPCVGVWIETFDFVNENDLRMSHPAWVCGLKPNPVLIDRVLGSHTLRGCVD